jgi:PPOX class probable FMN-dependent enzyme
MTDDPYRIESLERLRGLIGEPSPGTDAKVLQSLDDYAIDFLARCPFLVLSSSDAEGRLDASPKGDGPGFVLVEDEETVVIPDRPGNKLAYGHLNLLENPRVGLLCIVPGTPETLRINGRAELTCDPELLGRLAARGRPAVLAIRVRAEEVFFHCAKAFIRSKLWAPETWPEDYRISFGEMFASRAGADAAMAKNVDAAIEENYRSEL